MAREVRTALPSLRGGRPYHRRVMGFNPFRQQRRSVWDVALVAGFALVTLGFVLWALLAG